MNNPTHGSLRTVLRRRMALPGLDWEERTVDLGPGEYRVVDGPGADLTQWTTGGGSRQHVR